MKFKRLLAVVLGAALLTGCTASGGADLSSDSSSNIEESSEYSSEESSERSSSMSGSSSSSSSSVRSVESKIEPKIPQATFDDYSITVNDNGKYMTAPFTTDVPFENDVQYYLRIYFSDSESGEYELRWDQPFDTTLTSLNLKLHNGDNYYYIQFYTDEKEGKGSNKIYQWFDMPVKHKNFKFYTMVAAMYGDFSETLFGYPDYDEIDYYLRQGITPEYMHVDVYYKCLYCGEERFLGTYEFNYIDPGLKLIAGAHCENPYCSKAGSGGDILYCKEVE